MLILYTTDLHGKVWKYNRLVNLTKELNPGIVINGGDMLPKGYQGTVSYRMQEDFILYFLKEHFEEFEKLNIPHLCFPGNDDLKSLDSIFNNLCNQFKVITNIAQKKIEIQDYTFIGMNWVVDYPFTLKDRCLMDDKDFEFPYQFGKGILSTGPSEYKTLENWEEYAKTLPTIKEELNNLPIPGIQEKTIYIIHTPPYKIDLDVCADGRRVGSKSVYDFLLKKQPAFSLHGHIHESPIYSGKWFNKIGKTICIQPGQIAQSFTYVLIDTDKKEYNIFQEKEL